MRPEPRIHLIFHTAAICTTARDIWMPGFEARMILVDIEVYVWLILFNSWLRNCQYMLPAFFSLTSSISAKRVNVDQSKPLVGRDPCGRVLPGEKASALVEAWQLGQHLLHRLSLQGRVCTGRTQWSKAQVLDCLLIKVPESPSDGGGRRSQLSADLSWFGVEWLKSTIFLTAAFFC